MAKNQVTRHARGMALDHNPGATPLDTAPLQSESMRGTKALITGASRGIGFAAAKQMGNLGAEIIVVAQDPNRIKSAVTELSNLGISTQGYAVDLRSPEAIAELAKTLNGQQIDVIVNSAGVMSDKTAKTLRCEDAEWQRVLDINLNAPFYVIKHLAPQMTERRQGRIINVTACLGRFSGPGTSGGLAPYRIAKAGLNALTKNLAAELGAGKRGVYVDAVCPGHCQTDMGGPDAPRTADQGAETITWLAAREVNENTLTGLIWEDRAIVPW